MNGRLNMPYVTTTMMFSDHDLAQGIDHYDDSYVRNWKEQGKRSYQERQIKKLFDKQNREEEKRDE